MCNPVAGVMAVTSVAGAATSAMAASDAASEQQQAARQARDAAARNAAITRAYRDQQYALAIGYQQELSEWQNSVYLQNAASVADSTRGQYNAIVKRIDQIRAKTLDDIGRASRSGPPRLRREPQEIRSLWRSSSTPLLKPDSRTTR